MTLFVQLKYGIIIQLKPYGINLLSQETYIFQNMQDGTLFLTKPTTQKMKYYQKVTKKLLNLQDPLLIGLKKNHFFLNYPHGKKNF